MEGVQTHLFILQTERKQQADEARSHLSSSRAMNVSQQNLPELGAACNCAHLEFTSRQLRSPLDVPVNGRAALSSYS